MSVHGTGCCFVKKSCLSFYRNFNSAVRSLSIPTSAWGPLHSISFWGKWINSRQRIEVMHSGWSHDLEFMSSWGSFSNSRRQFIEGLLHVQSTVRHRLAWEKRQSPCPQPAAPDLVGGKEERAGKAHAWICRHTGVLTSGNQCGESIKPSWRTITCTTTPL